MQFTASKGGRTALAWKIPYKKKKVIISKNFFQISGGPLKRKYAFAQYHFHWGSNDGRGAEHRIDGTKL